ncbi:MAG: DUF4153 domain-containing protein [Flavobacterium sp.]|nr:DUF4153 domain-containing protein [Flavobacterium sp.]
MQKKILNVFRKVQIAFLKYPLVLAMAVIMSASVVMLIESSGADNFRLVKIVICSSLGISLLFALKMLSQRLGKTYLLQIVGILFLIGFYFILPASEDDFTEVHVYILITSYILSHLLVSFIPFVNQQPEATFWQYNKNLFVNIVLTAIFTGVLTGGVMLAVVAVEQLFALDFRQNIYPQIFFVMSITGSTLIFLLFSDSGLSSLERSSEYPVVLKFFTQFILIPLLLIYLVILYFYAGKIAVMWELPEGWVSYLILAYSIIGILALLLVHPLKLDSARSWVKIFSNLFYYTLVPLLVLLFVAIATRILEYGYTEPRYFVVLIAVWLLFVVIYFIVFKKSSIKFIPISLFIFGLFSLIFPYLNAFSVAKRSQRTQLELLLAENRLAKDGKIDFNAEISSDMARNIADKFEFLSLRQDYDYLGNYLQDSLHRKLIDSDRWYIRDQFTNVTHIEPVDRSEITLVSNPTRLHPVSGFRYAISEEDLHQSAVVIDGKKLRLTKNLYSSSQIYKLTLSTGEEIDLLPIIKNLYKKYQSPDIEIETAKLFIEFSLGELEIKMILGAIDRSDIGQDDPINIYDSVFLIK